MKASIKFREDRDLLVRAKVPVGVLGLPFVSGVTTAAGRGGDEDARELRLDLSTALRAGPSVRFSYRPNETVNPFSLVLKISVGAPCAGSHLSMAAEFGLLGSRPTFSLLLKPRIGDFSFRKSVSAAAPAAVMGASNAVAVKVAPVGDGHAIGAPIEFRSDNGIHPGRKCSSFPVDVSAFTLRVRDQSEERPPSPERHDRRVWSAEEFRGWARGIDRQPEACSSSFASGLEEGLPERWEAVSEHREM
ncbi:hypothetical protein BHM03_00055820 [Ensete ventricosum]|nr:hypothetical protein BHM03_00055820 [Ensete ventricosum]